MVAEYSCSAGYSLIGAGRLVCTETGEWDNTPPTCTVVQCQQPVLPAFSQMEAGIALTYTYGETISYLCVRGSQMVGRSTIECRENNTFVPGPPICKLINCGSPGMIVNGYSQAPDTTFGNRANFQCRTGFLMVGRNYRLCKAGGWDGKPPVCEEIKSSLPVRKPDSGESIKGSLQSNAHRKQGLGTIGIVAICITSFCTGIALTAGVSHIKKKRWCRPRKCKPCKRVHIIPQPNPGQVEVLTDHPT
ncbi:E-selectin-like [Amblyraja radiata]|uniref:E-selectin-like n=1 Tax=Amblyraja radiata TaxID=386614 RepID=UPI001402FFAC|nr:E-selectin-like [Amblyraja radiata]